MMICTETKRGKATLNKRGSLLLVIGISLFVLFTGLFILNTTGLYARLGLSKGIDALLILDAHSAASLLKSDLLKNAAIESNASCNPIGNYTKILSSCSKASGCSSTCQSVSFSFDHFQTTDSTPRTSVRLNELLSVSLVPVLPLSKHRVELKITEFNENRNQLLGNLTFTPISNGVGMVRNVRIILDLDQTLRTPASPDAGCTVCRSDPGSVCCAAFPLINLTFLINGSLHQGACDPNTHMFADLGLATGTVADQYMTSVAVKQNSTLNGYIAYSDNSFCISGVGGPPPSGTPVNYVIDAAIGNIPVGNTNAGNDQQLFLTTHGSLLNNSGTSLWATPDPKIVSIGFDPGTNLWLVMRYDGQLYSTKDITDQSTMYNNPVCSGPPTVEKIGSGKGPEPCTP